MQARILSAVAALALPATSALAAPAEESARYIALGAETEAPRGYVEMCSVRSEWCQPSRPSAPVADPAPASMPRSGSAFPVILSFNFSIPAEVLEQMGKAASAAPAPQPWLRAGAVPVRTAAPLAWTSSVAAIVAASPAGTLAAAAPLEAPAVQVAARAPRRDDAALDLLKAINRRVNGSVIQRRDAQIYGAGELWRRSGIGRGATGDCEDIAIEKRLQLVAEGFPADKLAFAVVYRRDVGLHTVLVARTTGGDVVLDSLDPYVSSWAKARYSWISVQSMDDPQRWYAPGSRHTA